MLNYLVIRLTARCRTEQGASAVEYALLIAGIALVCIPVSIAFYQTLKALFLAASNQVGISTSN